MKKRATIIDVAKAAGVSPSTVSRVLNGRSGNIPISEATRKQVEEAARTLDYEASVFAAALRTDRTGVIGAVIRDIRDPFLSLLLQEIQEAAHVAGQEILVGHARYDIDRAGRFLRLMRGRLFDGVILLGDMPGDNTVVRELRQYPVPFVNISRGTNAATPLVNVDENMGTTLALTHLVTLGHTRIGCVAGMVNAGMGERVEHYYRFLSQHELPVQPEYVQTGNVNHDDIAHALERIFNLPEPPTALFCTLDRVALMVMDVCRQKGIRVPDDISVIGFDDIEEAAFSYPALTTIRQPIDLMAQKAVDLLVECVESSAPADSPLKKQRHILPPTLIVRESCKQLME